MLGQNAFSHLGVFRTALVRRVGGFRLGFEGSQDHDLVLRCADETTPERIRHIPRVLYHWRVIPGSTAATPDAKPYAWAAGARAVAEHLRRRRIRGTVASSVGQFYRVDYVPAERWPKVSIVLPTACPPKLLRQCAESVLGLSTYPDFELLVTARRSPIGGARKGPHSGNAGRASASAPARLSARSRSIIRASTNGRYKQAAGSVICLLNDDTEVITPDWLEQMVMRLRLDSREPDAQAADVAQSAGGGRCCRRRRRDCCITPTTRSSTPAWCSA